MPNAAAKMIPTPAPSRSLAFRRLYGRRLTVDLVVDPGPMALGAAEARASIAACLDALGGHPDLELRREATGSADLVHFLGWGPALLASKARRATHRLCAVTALPGPREGAIDRMTRPAAERWLRAVARFSNAVLAGTDATARHIRALGVRAPVWTLPAALPEGFVAAPSLRRRGRSLLGIDPERPLVLGMGGLRREDGIADFAATAKRVPSALFLWVDQDAGRGPTDAVGLDAFVGDGPPNLRFAGALPEAELPAVFNAADALLHPAHRVPAPGVPLLAAGCGVPVVARALPPESQPWEAELLVASDAAGFAQALSRLLTSVTERARWSALALRQAEPHRAAAVVERLVSLYDLAACGKLAPRPAESARARLVEWSL